MKRTQIIIVVAIVVAVVAALVGVSAATYRHQALAINQPVRVEIPRGSTYDALLDSLEAHNCLNNRALFSAAGHARGLATNVRSGSYLMQPHMSLATVIQKLYTGNQDPIKLTIGKYRTTRQLADHLGAKLDLEADTIYALLTDSATLANYGCTPQTVFLLFPQNTYEVYWDIKPNKLLDRMKRESNHFWNPTRLDRCQSLGLTPEQVLTLASIIDEETNVAAEKDTMASVYLNRLRRGIPLQADPTVRYALGDFTIRRILTSHTQIVSPYNTYLNRGLPPGPICTPLPKTIDAVLANLQTNYLYFCAKEDFSGRHNFAATLKQHQANANRYHQALTARNIK